MYYNYLEVSKDSKQTIFKMAHWDSELLGQPTKSTLNINYKIDA